MMEPAITESSGNVFTDVGFEPPEAAILEMRAALLSDLRLYIQSSGMTQAEAAEKLQIAQSRVLDMRSGKWKKFSLEMLITLEARVGQKIIVEPASMHTAPSVESGPETHDV